MKLEIKRLLETYFDIKDEKLDRDIMEQNIKLYQKWDKQPLIDFLDYLYKKSEKEFEEMMKVEF